MLQNQFTSHASNLDFLLYYEFRAFKKLKAISKKNLKLLLVKKTLSYKEAISSLNKILKKYRHRSYTNPAFLPIQIIQLQLYEQNKNQLNFESK